MSFCGFGCNLVLRVSGMCSNAVHPYTCKCFTTDFLLLKLLNFASGIELCAFTGPFMYKYLAIFHASAHNLYGKFAPWSRDQVFSASVQFIFLRSVSCSLLLCYTIPD